MAELLIRIVDKGDGMSFRGDVIDVRPDRFNWGIEERRAPFWRIFTLPGRPDGYADMMLPLRDSGGAGRGDMVYAKRAKHFDLDTMTTQTRRLPGVVG